MLLWDILFAPFSEFGFMRRALAATFALSLAAGPLGVFLIFRRLSLMGDALSHAILPGVAVGFLVAGLSLPAMMLGGVVTGLLVALFSGWVARMTPMREDTSFATFYLISLGLGVLLVSVRGSNVDLMHVLFGSVLGLDDLALLTVTSVSSLTLVVFAVIYRPLAMDSVDPFFKQFNARASFWAHMLFLVLLVITLVAGFQVLGTLMVVGLMILPAAAARFLVQSAHGQLIMSALMAVLASYVGLLGSYHFDVPTSPAIILTAGLLYLFALFFGPHGGLRQVLSRGRQSGMRTLVVVLTGTGLLFGGYSPLLPAQQTQAPLRVVSSFPILADFVRVLGGDKLQVHSIVAPEMSAHHFEPRSSDMQALMQADLLVVNGAGFEPWWEQLVAAAGYEGPVLIATEGLELRPFDPHAWLDVNHARHYVARIYEQLRLLAPAQWQAGLQDRYEAYDQQLSALHADLLQTFDVGAQDCARVVIGHDSMFYFQQTYRCPEFMPLQGANLEAELSAGALAEVIRSVRAQQLQAVVPEFGMDTRLLAQIARETQVPMGRSLYTETFGPPGQGVDSYLSLMRWNQEVLQEVLD